MNNRFLSIAMVLFIGFSSLTAEARRMGLGKSMGKQSNNVSQTQGTSPHKMQPLLLLPLPQLLRHKEALWEPC